MKKSPVFFPIILSVLFVSVLLAVYAYQQSQISRLQSLIDQSQIFSSPTPTAYPTSTISATSTWQTYYNEKVGFEFQYPSKWKILEKDKTCEPTIPVWQLRISFLVPKDNQSNVFIPSNLAMEIYKGDESYSGFNVKEHLEENKSHYKNVFNPDTSNTAVKVTKKIMGDKTYTWYDDVSGVSHGSTTIYWLSGSKGILMGDLSNCGYEPDKTLDYPPYSQNNPDIIKILSTFKFTSPTSSINYGDWRTYQKENTYAYVNKIYSENNQIYIDADYVEFLSCNTCPNGFSIKNDNNQIRKLKFSPNIEIYIQSPNEKTGSQDIKKISINDFINDLQQLTYKRLMRLSIKDNLVMGMLEQYIP